jgi:multidrug resistance efflux pump
MSLILRRVLLIAVPVGILGIGVVGFGAMMASREKPETKAEEPKGLPVYVSSVTKGTVRLEVTTQGEVQAQRTVDMAAQVGGRVVYVSPQLVDGGAVRQGDVVLRLDDADYQLAVTRVRAGVASAEQRLAR